MQAHPEPEGYRPRIVDAELNELLADLPAVSLERLGILDPV